MASGQRPVIQLARESQLSESAMQEATIAPEPEPGPALPPVSVDDVLDVHEFLQSFDGDFKRLFDQQRPSRSARG